MGKVLTVVLGVSVVLGAAWYATHSAPNRDPAQQAAQQPILEKTRADVHQVEGQLERNAAAADQASSGAAAATE